MGVHLDLYVHVPTARCERGPQSDLGKRPTMLVYPVHPDIIVIHYCRADLSFRAEAGISRDSIEHAFTYLLALADLDPDSDPAKVLIIGPDDAGNLLELIALVLAGDELLIIHAMPLRPTFYTLLPDPTE